MKTKVLITGVAGFIGSLMVTKRMSLMVGALGHLTLPGIALALLYNFDGALGAVLFLFLGIILIWFLEQKTGLPMQALTAIVFASSFGISFLFLPEGKAMQALIGDISQISFLVTITTLFLSVLIFFVIKSIFSSLILISISKDIASTMHINVKKYNFIYLISIACIVALGVKIVGGIMTAALVAIPACISKNLSKNLLQYSYGSMLVGGLSSFFGTLVYLLTNIPAGPLIIIFSSFLSLIGSISS